MPWRSVDLHKRRAVEGILNMFEHHVCIFMTRNMVALFFPTVNLFSFGISSTVPEACVSSERLLFLN